MVETDTLNINSEKDYAVPGYTTIFHEKQKATDKTRMICLIKEEDFIKYTITVRRDLMNKNFPILA